MASGPITSWEIDGETMETVTDFIFLASKITADGYCSHEKLKRHLLLGRKVMTNLDSIFKKRSEYAVIKNILSKTPEYIKKYIVKKKKKKAETLLCQQRSI